MLGKNFAPLAENLNNVDWGEFLLKDLFEKLNLKFKRKKFDKRFDISQEPTEEFSLPLVNAKDGNNGIMYYGREKDWEFAEMTIDIVNDGAISTANVYPQPQKTGVLYNAYLIKPKFTPSIELLNFFATAIFKSIKHKFSYEYKASWDRVSQEKIFLPTKDGEIDFEFMEKFITKLEAERISELEAYLKENNLAYLTAAGLKDFILTDEEKFALENLNSCIWQKFLLKDLFEKISTIKLPYKAKDLPSYPTGDNILPCLTSSFHNQGLNCFCPRNGATVLKNVISIPSNSDVYRSYYQANDFTVLSDAYAIKSKKELSAEQYLFMVACINKVTNLKIYSYKNKLGGWNIVKNKYILLPTKDGEIDYEFMEKFIMAVQKVIIADVVKYSEEKISAYRQAANK